MQDTMQGAVVSLSGPNGMGLQEVCGSASTDEDCKTYQRETLLEEHLHPGGSGLIWAEPWPTWPSHSDWRLDLRCLEVPSTSSRVMLVGSGTQWYKSYSQMRTKRRWLSNRDLAC